MDVVLSDAAASTDALSAAESVLTAIAGSRPRVDSDTRLLSVPITVGAVTLPELVRRLDAAGVEAEDVSIRRPNAWTRFPGRDRSRNRRESGGGGMIGVVTDGAAAAGAAAQQASA